MTGPGADTNLQTYKSDEVVAGYAGLDHLMDYTRRRRGLC